VALNWPFPYSYHPGALLFRLGGFPAPFVVMGCLLLGTLPLLPAAMMAPAPHDGGGSPRSRSLGWKVHDPPV
jgi:hypothetical protein